jgi:hypothetical protein
VEAASAVAGAVGLADSAAEVLVEAAPVEAGKETFYGSRF